jgi:hypothetical protein
MRLRQVALVAADLDHVTAQLGEQLGLKVAFNDPHIIHYGLKNAVLPAGDGFIEVVQPVAAEASAARFLARREGDAGYMVILQVADAEAERARMVALGVRVVDDLEMADYRAAHFHPGDFGGVLVSVDEQKTALDPLATDADWYPAGPDWRDFPSDRVRQLKAVVIAAPDPQALAARWSQLLARPLEGLTLKLDRGAVRFETSDGAPTHIRAVELAGALDEAVALIGGVEFRRA